MNKNISQENKCSQKCAVDFLKLIMAFFVVGIHSQLSKFFGPVGEGVLDNIFALAVPYFFICSGYFLFNKINISNINKENSIVITNYLKKIIKLYIVWSIIYLPLTIYGELFVWKTSTVKAVVKIIKNYILVGENFYSWQLWYLLGLIVAVIIIYFLAKLKLNYKIITIISLVLFLIGIGIDTLSVNEVFENQLNVYYTVFSTTRNGFFYGFFYVSLGMLIANKEEKLGIIDIAILILSIVGLLLFNASPFKRLYIALLAFIIFKISLNVNLKNSPIYLICRKLSIKVYLIHMYFVAIYRLFISSNEDVYNYLVCFVFASLLSVIVAVIFDIIDKKTNIKLAKLLF